MANIIRSPIWPDPRVKPPFGAAEIDWGHPMARGLIAFLVFNEWGGLPSDLAANTQADLISGTWGVNQDPGVITASSGDRVRFPLTTRYTLGSDVPFSISFRLIQTGLAATGADGYVANRNAFGAGMWQIYDDGGTLSYGAEGIDAAQIGPRIGNGLSTVTVVRPVGGSPIAYFKNGADIGTSGAAITAPTMTAQRLVIGAIGEDATTNNVFGAWSWLALHRGRALTLSDHQQFMNTPYAMLRPIVRRRWSVPAAVAVAGARGHGMLLAGIRNRALQQV